MSTKYSFAILIERFYDGLITLTDANKMIDIQNFLGAI